MEKQQVVTEKKKEVDSFESLSKKKVNGFVPFFQKSSGSWTRRLVGFEDLAEKGAMWGLKLSKDKGTQIFIKNYLFNILIGREKKRERGKFGI